MHFILLNDPSNPSRSSVSGLFNVKHQFLNRDIFTKYPKFIDRRQTLYTLSLHFHPLNIQLGAPNTLGSFYNTKGAQPYIMKGPFRAREHRPDSGGRHPCGAQCCIPAKPAKLWLVLPTTCGECNDPRPAKPETAKPLRPPGVAPAGRKIFNILQVPTYTCLSS